MSSSGSVAVNRVAHVGAHGQALRHRPGVRLRAPKSGEPLSPGETPRPAPLCTISRPRSWLSASPEYPVYSTLTHRYLPTSAAAGGYRSRRFDRCYYVPMEHLCRQPRGRQPWTCTTSKPCPGVVPVTVPVNRWVPVSGPPGRSGWRLSPVPTSGCSHCRVSSPASSTFVHSHREGRSVLFAGSDSSLPFQTSVALTVIW